MVVIKRVNASAKQDAIIEWRFCLHLFCTQESHQLVVSIGLEVQAVPLCVGKLGLGCALMGSSDNKVLSTILCVACLQLVSMEG